MRKIQNLLRKEYTSIPRSWIEPQEKNEIKH